MSPTTENRRKANLCSCGRCFGFLGCCLGLLGRCGLLCFGCRFLLLHGTSCLRRSLCYTSRSCLGRDRSFLNDRRSLVRIVSGCRVRPLNFMTYHCRRFLHTFGRSVSFRLGRSLCLCCLGGGRLLRRGLRSSSLGIGLLGFTSCLGACGFCCFGSLL